MGEVLRGLTEPTTFVNETLIGRLLYNRRLLSLHDRLHRRSLRARAVPWDHVDVWRVLAEASTLVNLVHLVALERLLSLPLGAVESSRGDAQRDRLDCGVGLRGLRLLH